MSKQYNDVVTLVRGKFETPALVVQSVTYPDGEHLTVVSLDPEKASPLLSGMNVDAAIRRDFVTPLTEGKTFGWKEQNALDVVPATVSVYIKKLEEELAEAKASQGQKFMDNILPKIVTLSRTVAEINPSMETSIDGTLISANTLLVAAEEEISALKAQLDSARKLAAITPVTEKPSAPEQLDEAQGAVEPGDPNSPHAINAPVETKSDTISEGQDNGGPTPPASDGVV